METNIYRDNEGADTLEDIAEDILQGLGCNTEANQDYMYLRLVELVSYVTELASEKAALKATEHLRKKLDEGKTSPIEDDRGTIEL